MLIMLTIGIFIAKFLAVAVVGMFFLEDLELTKELGGGTYTIYFALGCCTFLSLLFFALGKRLLWLFVFLACGIGYLTMYNTADGIKEIHQKNDLKSRYFNDVGTFTERMAEVMASITKK